MPIADDERAAPWWTGVQRWVVFAAGYVVLAFLALSLGVGDALAPLWPATGLAVVGVYLWGRRFALAVFAAAVAVALDAGASWPGGLGFAGCEVIAALAGAYGLRRYEFNPRFELRRDLFLLLGFMATAAVPAAIGLVLLGARSLEPTTASGWAVLGGRAWLAVMLGSTLLALPLMAVNGDTLRGAVKHLRWRATLLLAMTAMVAMALLLTRSSWPLPMQWALGCIVGAALALLVLRAGIAVASTCALLLGAGAAAAAAAGTGVFAPLPAPETPALLWAFVAAPLLLCVGVHAVAIDLINVERRWLLALDGAGLGVSEWRAHRDEGRTSDHWGELIGTDSASFDAWMSKVHEDDRVALHDLMQQLDAGDQGKAQREIRVAQGQGWRWLELQLLVVQRDHHGGWARLIATLSDTSQRHHAEERQRLSASLFQHLHEGLLIADAQMRVLDVNPAYSTILGVPRAELLGQVPSLLQATSADPLIRQQRLLMWTALHASGRWRGEVVERRRNAEPCTLQVTISTVNGADGNAQYHVLVISDITEQRLQRDRLERQAHFDELTRLPNRARLLQMLAEAMHAAESEGYLLTVCYLDLDRFKPVNDRFGHAAGDRLLVELAGRLRSALRSSELWSDTAGRLGGDEFVLLLRASTAEESRLALERVLRVVSQPYVIEAAGEPVQVTASIGATVYPIDRSDADTLLRHADQAMYDAKQAGRNRYEFFDHENRRRAEERVMAIGQIQQALDNREFVLYYQPKVDMRRGVVLGLEALLRWDRPQQGLIAPMQFLPLIENTGLSSHVGDWVLAQAIEHLAQWKRAGLDISISVNVSARHLQEADFAQRLAELLARHDEALATSLELEVLETAAHADIQATSALLARCRALGVRFALDDFGTGYSTLSYLKQLPVDVLKIDRSFVHHMLDDPQDRAIVAGIIGLARTFQCVVVAEGVESPAQARTLLDMGCNIGQGTGIAAPLPANAVAAWIRDYRGLFAIAAAPASSASRSAAE